MKIMHIAYLALGSNLGDSHQHLLDAIEDLKDDSNIELLNISKLYLSRPVDGSEQNSFYNIVLSIKTYYLPDDLLYKCQQVEKSHHKAHIYRWGPRSLDIDILCFDDLKIESQNLNIPHPEIANRDFVLTPLLEIAPNISLVTLGKISELPAPPSNIFKTKTL